MRTHMGSLQGSLSTVPHTPLVDNSYWLDTPADRADLFYSSERFFLFEINVSFTNLGETLSMKQILVDRHC